MSKLAKEMSRRDDMMTRLIVSRFNNEYPGFLQAEAIRESLTIAHCNGCELDLDGLLTASTVNFTHDIHGLCAHTNKETGPNTEAFMPRCLTGRARTAIEEAAAAARAPVQEGPPQGYGESVEIAPDDIGDAAGGLGVTDGEPLPK